MRIEQLQDIVEVDRTHSLTKAAENLYVTQQTISKAINKLENELGVVLMIRSHKGVQLTDVGKVFVEKAAHIVRDFQELYETTCVSAGSNLSGQVTIYQSTYTSHVLSSRFLTSMRRQYPKMHVIVEEKLTSEMIEGVKHSEGDIALVQAVNGNCGVGRVADYEDELDWEEIFRDTLVACVADNNPLAKKESVSLKELAKYPIAWAACGHMEDILQQDYKVGIKVLINSTNTAIQRDAIMEGAAVSFSTEMITHSEGYDSTGYKMLPIKENMRLSTYLIKPKGYELNKLQRVAVEELKHALQKI